MDDFSPEGGSATTLNDAGISQELADALMGAIPNDPAAAGAGGGSDGTSPPPPPTEPSTPADGGQAGGTPGGQPASPPPPPPAEPATQAQPGGAGPSDETAALRQQLAVMEARLAELSGGGTAAATPAAAPQPAQSPGGQPVADTIPPYLLSIPASIIEGIAHEDVGVRAQALQNFAAGVARTVHRTLRGEMEARLAEVPNVALERFQEVAAGQSIFQDFYGTYPRLNDASLHRVVQMVAQGYQKEHPQEGYGEKARREIAKRVYAKLGWPWQDGTPTSPPPPPPPQPSVGNGARPGAPFVATGEQQQVLDLVNNW